MPRFDLTLQMFGCKIGTICVGAWIGRHEIRRNAR
jgi:hypothetical protein